MNKNSGNSTRRTTPSTARILAAALAISALPASVQAMAVALDPTLPGQFAAGTGASAVFHRIPDAWTGSSVLWNESLHQYSNTPGDGFQRIGEFGWGTGIWGLADWRSINAAGSLLPMLSWSGSVATINQGDLEYRSGANPNTYQTWGAADPLPPSLFAGAPGSQDNWTAHFNGYLRVTTPGEYNFGVLYDDGFFLRIWGDGDTPLEISSDFLSSRDRLGFAQDLALGTGLYRFELGAYERLQVGIVNLAWRHGDSDWLTVPTEFLVIDPVAISAPGTAAAMLVGLSAFGAVRRKARRQKLFLHGPFHFGV